jgi:hypothetical protein
MATDTVYDAIRAYFEATWTATGLDRLFWENEIQPPGDDPIIAIEMRGTYYGQESIGEDVQANNRWDEEGVLWVHCLVTKGTGARYSRELARRVAEMFRGSRLLSDSLEFLDASIGAGDSLDNVEGNWWCVTVTIDWRRMDA